MRIALVVERFDPRRGGLEKWSLQFVAELVRRRHEVHVVGREFSPEVARLAIVPHRVVGDGGHLWFASAAEAVLRRLHVDVIHDTGSGWHCDVFQPHFGCREAAIQRQLETTPEWWRPWKRRFQRWLPRYRCFRKLTDRQYVNDGRQFVALSHMVADEFRRHHGVGPEQIRVVYNGVDTERFSPAGRELWRESVRRRLGLDASVMLMLLVAHNFRLKGLDALLKSAARLAARGNRIHLAVVGGKRLGSHLRLACQLGADRLVTFTGPVDDPRPWYAAADVYVHPTFYDPCSLVSLEALSCGLPLVTTRRNGVSELIRPGREGLLLDSPRDVDGLTESLASLLDADRRAAMGAAARRLAMEYPFSRNVDALLDVYQQSSRASRYAA